MNSALTRDRTDEKDIGEKFGFVYLKIPQIMNQFITINFPSLYEICSFKILSEVI